MSFEDYIIDGAFSANMRSVVALYKEEHPMLTKVWKASARWNRSILSVNIWYTPLLDNEIGIVLTTGDIVTALEMGFSLLDGPE